MVKQRLVVVGNGMAGVRCVEEILKLAPDAFEITIFGSEPHPNYNRILLSKVLQGDTNVGDITINDWQWYKENGIVLYAGDPIIEIDTVSCRVISESGRNVKYDRLIVATGSLPFMLPLPGADKPGVTAFRDIADCNAMMEASKSYKKAVVIGGGLLGLEAARGLLNLGMDVHVVHNLDYLMNRQLDPTAADLLKLELEKQGMKFLIGKQTEQILGKKRAEGLLFKDGTSVEGDLVVIAVGIRPNVKLAAESGIKVNHAILVNDYMETSAPNVYAVGECAEHRGIVYGMVAPLYEQGKVLAKRICGVDTAPYEGSIMAAQLKVSGIDLFSAGDINDSEITASIQYLDGVNQTYKKICVKDGKIVGAVLFGDISESGKLLGYIKQTADVSVLEQQAFGEGADDDDLIGSMSDTESICSCNGVTKGAIACAIREGGLQTVEEVRACTKASSSCGGCKPLVAAVLKYTLANAADASEVRKETVCGCTDYSHEELKAAIRAGGFATEAGAMQGLGWKRPEGCRVCKPALRYYVGASIRGADSGSAAADSLEAAYHSGQAGETAAEVPAAAGAAYAPLADRTCSLTPRMYGGLTSAEQLRRIADVIDKYGISQVKLTDGRVNLCGLSPEQAAAAGAELGMMPASATYGKTSPQVATCAGPAYDRSALRDSVRLGALLERRLEGLQLPSSVSVAVSGSPLHRAGTLAKDLGIAGAPAGWEIYVGGSGGAKLKPGQLLSTEPDEENALLMAAAFLQLYSEDAFYGETTAQWIERTGLVRLRETLFNRELRTALVKRLEAQWTTADETNGQEQRQPEAASLR
ncbi:nitrite reductase large subunit NirB [Paenibacillus tarimensis]